MTVDNFITQTEGYYNSKYNKFQKRAVLDWLNMRQENQVGFIYSEVLKMLSPVYKTPPGIFELEKAMKIVKKERWSEVNPVSLPEYPPATIKANQKVVSDLFKGLKSKIIFGKKVININPPESESNIIKQKGIFNSERSQNE